MHLPARARVRHGAVVEVPIDGDLTISTALALRDAAVAGLGPALLPHWIIDEVVAKGELVDCFPDWRPAATSFDTGAWLLYPARSQPRHGSCN